MDDITRNTSHKDILRSCDKKNCVTTCHNKRLNLQDRSFKPMHKNPDPTHYERKDGCRMSNSSTGPFVFLTNKPCPLKTEKKPFKVCVGCLIPQDSGRQDFFQFPSNKSKDCPCRFGCEISSSTRYLERFGVETRRNRFRLTNPHFAESRSASLRIDASSMATWPKAGFVNSSEPSQAMNIGFF